MKTLLSLRTENESIFDDSANGTPLKIIGNITSTENKDTFKITKGFIGVDSNSELENLDSFTLEATINPSALARNRQNIMESQTPPIALYIDNKGYLTGSVHLKNEGWVSLKSKTRLSAGKSQNILFSRNARGTMILEINGKKDNQMSKQGPLAAVGNQSFRIGAGAARSRHQFKGSIGNIKIRKGAFTTTHIKKRVRAARRLENAIKAKIGAHAHVQVNPSLDESHARLQPIKDIMNVAGVEKISDLSTLKLTVPTSMSNGKVLIAAKKTSSATINWKALATKFQTLNTLQKKSFLAKYVTNRNSSNILKDAKVTTPRRPATTTTLTHGLPLRITTAFDKIHGGVRISKRFIRANPRVEAFRERNRITDYIEMDKTELTVVNKAKLLEDLKSRSPEKLPMLGNVPRLLLLQTLPVNSSVIIAGTLDLSNTQLIIEPDVEKLYIIAEKVICGPNAKITWRKPGGSTPARLNNLDLDGRGWSGVQTKSGSRDGLDGDNARPGGGGINGALGRNAPHIELWVKNLTNVPSVDLNGEDGIKGGKGQQGGKGGNGANGKNGTYRWVWTPFGNIEWCDDEPGDGGDGGNGGRGGNGGKGGSGANGGKITIGVLDGTLAATVTAGQFRWKNQGGQKGRGGDPGRGGNGGRGGSRGYTTHCDQAKNGHNGAQGQPGTIGADGSRVGSDGIDRFFEFSQEAWDDMMTRPWITEISPNEVFPGNTITIKGSRFTDNDRVVLVGVTTLVPTINPDDSLSVTIPLTISGGTKSVFVRRAFDNTESNRIPIRIKPQLDTLPTSLAPLATFTISGRAFLPNATVLINGDAIPGTVNAAGTQIEFQMIGTGGTGSSGGSVTVSVRNPDGLVSNSRTAVMPRILEIPFNFGAHDLPFNNPDDGVPSWGTFEDTFGTAEVWHEQLDPIFGHPILTGAYYFFYEYFLKGKGNGGLATGFCTAMACFVADKLWTGSTSAHTTTKASIHKWLTAVHGKLLSRESLIHFHDQSQKGIPHIETTARAIERTFLTGCDRNVAPLLFFIPSGAIWDSGYIDKLGETHCIMPYRFVYPETHPGPSLSADGSTTVSSLDGVQLYCWDCNHPSSANCLLQFWVQGGVLNYSYTTNGSAKFDSSQGITLGHWTNGGYLLADHDLPFSGPFGLTSFIIDFLLSPADLEITDENGLRVGNFNNMIFSEIPDSHPAYLIKGAYLLPVGQNLTRKIVGNATGNYSFNSLMPDGTTIKLEDVPTKLGQKDTLIINNDASQIRFTPHEEKNFTMTFSKMVGNQMRALALSGIGGGPGTEIDVTIAPDLSIFRLGNRSTVKNVSVKAFSITKSTNLPINKNAAVALPKNHDLIVTVGDWTALNLNVETIAF